MKLKKTRVLIVTMLCAVFFGITTHTELHGEAKGSAKAAPASLHSKLTGNDLDPVKGQNQVEEKSELSRSETYKWLRHMKSTPSMNQPFGVAVAPSGNLYVADGNNKFIRVFDKFDKYKTSFGTGQFLRPYGIAVDTNGNIYVTDYDADYVRKFNKRFKLVKSWGGTGNGNSQFYGPAGIWVDGERVFVADAGNHRVQVFDRNGNLLTKFGSEGKEVGEFRSPWGVVVDGVGNVYVSEGGNNRVQKCRPQTNTFVCDQILTGEFRDPHLLCIDQNRERIYVADTGNNRIQVFDADWNFIAKFGSTGTGKRQMRRPSGVVVKNNGQVFVTDTLNNRAQRWCGYYPWEVVATPSEGYLNRTAVVSANDIWAVGTIPNQFFQLTESLILHWDGGTWSKTIDPPGGGLAGIAALSPNDVWAVGHTWECGVECIDADTLTLHFDGDRWEIVPSPSLPGSCSWMICSYPDDFLHDVAFASTNDVWAVGVGRGETLILHWDGTSWSISPSPSNDAGGSSLASVGVVSANNVWAVGQYDSNGNTGNLIVHWDGSSWKVVLSPNIPTGNNTLNDVAVVSANDVWAVGNYYENGISKNLVLHWDGAAWNVVPSPNVGTGNNTLTSVQASASNDIWAAGEGDGKALLLHWDSTTWSIVPTPNVGLGRFAGLGIVSPDDVWAVGSGPDGTLVARGGPPCSRTPR